MLFTNLSLGGRGGSELYLRDVAQALAGRGFQPLAYSPRLGSVSDQLRASGIPVVERLELLAEAPDLIHGQHHLQTLAALHRFPDTPAIFVCHGWLPWQERPPRFPRILRYVAVDRLRRERLVSEEGIPPERVEVIPNFVDVDRFVPRPAPLPPRPRRALVFSNHAIPGSGFVELVREACRREGVELETAGRHAGRLDRPEEVLPGFELVFARGRSAMEAMATGAAVVLCDVEGAGPLVTRDRVEELADLNFGIGALTRPHGLEGLRREIRRYDPEEASRVASWIGEHAPLGGAVDRLAALYRQVAAEWEASSPGERRAGESSATSVYLQGLDRHLERQEERLLDLHLEAVRVRTAAVAEGERRASEARVRRFAVARMRRLEVERDGLQRELDLLQGTLSYRLRAWLLRHPRLAAVFRRLKPGA